MSRRCAALFLLLTCVLAAHGPSPARPQAAWKDAARYRQVADRVRELLGREPRWFSPEAQLDLRSAQELITSSLEYWESEPGRARIEEQSRVLNQMAWARVHRVLDSLDGVERVVLAQAARVGRARRWASGSGTVLLRFDTPQPVHHEVPGIIARTIDLRRGAPEPITVEPGTTWAFLYFEGALSGEVPITIRSNGATASLRIPVHVEPPGRLQVRIAENGTPTPAAVGLFSSDGHLVCIDTAIFLYDTGPGDCGGRVRPYAQSHHWPGQMEMARASFVDGEFSVEAPAGEYTLIVAKGFEYIPERRSVRITAAETRTENVQMRRWTDMAARGWISADGHVHYSRDKAEVNQSLLTWTAAEDVRIASVMHMGDSERTHFPQYAWGTAGRANEGPYWLVPGQEDPRTDELGHTLHMNLESPVRFADRYYIYRLVFEGVKKQGGLTGYAHVYQPDRMSFWARRGMSLDVPRGFVDFTEVAEFGDLNPRLYFEFLNLGFRLTATAGSDVPWGSSIGSSRMYAYTGGDGSPEAFFRAVHEGRTFVSTGNMLEFTVNGARPGEEVSVKPGETVRVRAVASGYSVLPRFVELVEQGDAVHVSVAEDPQARTVVLEADVRVRNNTWLVARCHGAFTSPVFVRVGPGRFWKRAAVPELVKTRLEDLDAIERTASAAAANSALRRDARDLLEEVRKSRAVYRAMEREAQEEAAADAR
jgi:hypothetical protein